MRKIVSIDGKAIGKKLAPYLVAEIGLNHNHDIELAKKMIQSAKKSGADAVIGEGETSIINNPPQDLREKVAEAYTQKYADLGYSPTPEMWENGVLFEIRLIKALAWTAFMKDTTKFEFD